MGRRSKRKRDLHTLKLEDKCIHIAGCCYEMSKTAETVLMELRLLIYHISHNPDCDLKKKKKQCPCHMKYSRHSLIHELMCCMLIFQLDEKMHRQF